MSVAKRKSPITGEEFPALSKEYKKKKEEDGLSGVPDLQYSGDMLDALDFRITRSGIEIGVYGDRAEAADGHNNLSGDSNLPLRQFLPKEGEGFTPAIETEINRILMDAVASDFGVDLSDIETSSELYDIVGQVIGETSRAEIRSTILRNPALFNALSEADILDLL